MANADSSEYSGSEKDIYIIQWAMLLIVFAQFALGWWFFIDGVVYGAQHPLSIGPIKFEDWVPGVCSTLGFFLVNLVNRKALVEQTYEENIWRARLFTMIAFVISIGSISGSLVLLAIKYAPAHSANESYVGATIVLQSFLIFISSMMFWMRDVPGDYDSYSYFSNNIQL